MKPVLRLTASLLLAGAALQATAETTPVQRTLTIDDLLRVHDVSDPQVSPDGQWVAYIVSSADREADEVQSSVWMVSWDGRQRLALTHATNGTSKPRWSPDGCCLSFIAAPTDSAKEQIMLLDRRGGEARALTGVEGEIDDYAWSPDGKHIVIDMEPAEESKTPKPIVIDAWHFKQDEGGYLRAGSARHLYLLDVQSKRLDPLTADSGYNEDLAVWSTDSRQIAFIRTKGKGPDRDGREDIEVMEARSGATARTIVRPYAPNSQKLLWSDDNTQIAYLQGLEPKLNAYIQDKLFLVPVAGGPSRALTDKLDRAVMSYAFADRTAMTIAVEDDGVVYPARIDLASGTITRQDTAGPAVVSAVSSAAGHIALLQSNEHSFAEIYALEGDHIRKLTSHNDALLSELSLGTVEDIRFKSRDGTEIHGQILKPPSFVAGRKYPTLLWIHGGPNGQDQHSLALDAYEFEPQLFAARGYLVLRVNYRGSSGRGASFARAIVADWGHKEVEDVLAGVEHLVAVGLADPNRLAVGGWSYGGLLTDYTIATDRRFKAAVSGAGSGNQLSMFGSDQYVLQYVNEVGPPWSNTDRWLKLSYPFFKADRIHTPTLFLGGESDFNVPIAGGEQMYEALRTLGVPAQLVIYPGEHHILTRPSFVKDLAERVTGWIEHYVPP